ncbi:IclR family transcriptional regulator [Saccharopolyspora cebuensis]|uniref:IclR family transcriptional regulator n=1 Tax=Saccharopolyspora cebuensis TaxID=418759 RepID=A0ABV4CEG3_9PSEU
MGTSGKVPALRRGLDILGVLAEHAGPVPADVLVRELRLPRSTTYHLLAELVAAGYVTHLPEEHRYGLGAAAFELGAASLRHLPLRRLGDPLLRRLVDEVGATAHLGVLHGGEARYVVKQRPARPQTLVTAVGVRLPAQLTASGRSMLARLPAAQVRALLPVRERFVLRTGRGPRDLPGLRRVLAVERRRGWSVEDGHVTAGFASVGCPVLDRSGWPVAAISVTFRHHCPDGCERTWPDLAAQVRRAAAELAARLDGRPVPRKPPEGW